MVIIHDIYVFRVLRLFALFTKRVVRLAYSAGLAVLRQEFGISSTKADEMPEEADLHFQVIQDPVSRFTAFGNGCDNQV